VHQRKDEIYCENADLNQVESHFRDILRCAQFTTLKVVLATDNELRPSCLTAQHQDLENAKPVNLEYITKSVTTPSRAPRRHIWNKQHNVPMIQYAHEKTDGVNLNC